MEVLKTDHPLGCGAMYQFRDHKKLGLPFGQGLTDHELRIFDIRLVAPIKSANFLPEDNKLKLIFKSGYKKHLLIDKFLQKKALISFEGHKTLWQVVDILYLQHHDYREITVEYFGIPSL